MTHDSLLLSPLCSHTHTLTDFPPVSLSLSPLSSVGEGKHVRARKAELVHVLLEENVVRDKHTFFLSLQR